MAGFTTTFSSITGNFQLLTYTFTAAATDAAELRFFNTSPTPDFKTYDIDAVVIEEGNGPVVPPNPFIGDPAQVAIQRLPPRTSPGRKIVRCATTASSTNTVTTCRLSPTGLPA